MNGALIFGKLPEWKKSNLIIQTLIEFNFQIVLYNDMALMHTLIIDVRCTEMTTAIFSGKEKENWTTQLMWAFHAIHEWVVSSERRAPSRSNGSVCFIGQENCNTFGSPTANHSIILAHYEEMNSEHQNTILRRFVFCSCSIIIFHSASSFFLLFTLLLQVKK